MTIGETWLAADGTVSVTLTENGYKFATEEEICEFDMNEHGEATSESNESGDSANETISIQAAEVIDTEDTENTISQFNGEYHDQVGEPEETDSIEMDLVLEEDESREIFIENLETPNDLIADSDLGSSAPVQDILSAIPVTVEPQDTDYALEAATNEVQMAS